MDARGMNPSAIEDTENYKKIVDLANEATVIYIGWATMGTATSSALWKIKKITISSSVYTMEWAGGAQAFSHVWDDRTTTSFS